MTSQLSDQHPKDFGQDQGDTEIPIRDFLLSQEISNVEESTINTIIWYYQQMNELNEQPPSEICANDIKKCGKWARPYIDEKLSQKSYAPMKGHLKDGVAHGIGLIRASPLKSKTYKDDLSFIYIGTFVNGMMHGYGKLLFVQSKSAYEGEFLEGLPHGQGKWTEPKRTLDKLNAKKNNLDIATNSLQMKHKEGLWEYGSIVPHGKIKESQRLAYLAKWSERQDKLVAEHKELLRLQKEAEEALDAKIQQERRAWEDKRELERANEQPIVIKNRLRFFKGLETFEGTGIYPEQNLKKLLNAHQSRKSLHQEEDLSCWAPANQDFFQQDRHLRLVFEELHKTEEKLISYCDKVEKFSNSDDPSEVKKRYKLCLKFQKQSLSDNPNDEFKEEMKFIDEKLYAAADEKIMPHIQEKQGSFWNPYYFPAQDKHNWVRENISGMKYVSFDKIEKYLFPEETGQQNKERRENEDDVRAKAVSFKFLVCIMVLNILSYMLYHGFFSWISPKDQIEYEHRFNVTQICQGETLFQNLTSSGVHELKILPKGENGKRQISIDGSVIGSKVCIKGNEGRGVIFRSLENDMFKQVNGSIFSVTSRGRIEQWYTARNKHDNGATEPRPSFVNWVVKDQEFEDYGNREVNLGSDVNTDRGSEFIIIDTEKMVDAEDDELKFLFCKEIFYMSDFFIFVFAYILLMWVLYSAYATIKAFRTFGKQAKSPKAVSSIMVLVLYTYDFVKDYQLLITQKHHWSFVGLYSFTIAFAIVYNMYQSRIIHFALRERGLPVLKERTPGKYSYWRKLTDPGQPIEDIGEFSLFVRSFKSQMGFNFDTGDRDQAQKRYLAEANLKKYENIPQIMLVLSESFIGGKTIMFVQLFNPTFGLIMSVATFAAQAGHLFKAETDYFYFSEFIFTTPKQLDLKTENEIAFHKALKKKIMDTTDGQKPEEWQSISRLNSGSMLISNAFNVQDQDKVLNKLLFRSRKYSREERLIRGLENILFTQGFLLVLFIILFKLFLNPETEVKALIENQMVVDPAGINDWWFQIFRSYSHLILGFLLLTPTILIVILRSKLLLKERRRKRFEIKEDRQLTEPLLDKNQSVQVQDDSLDDQKELLAQECNHCGHKLQEIKYFDKIQQMKLAFVKCKVEKCDIIDIKSLQVCGNKINMQCSNFSNCKTMICYDCAKGRYKMQEDEVIETTGTSICIQMSQRAEFTYRGLLKIQEKCDKIAIKANWFNSFPQYRPQNRSQLYLQLRKVVDQDAEEEDDPFTESEDEDDSQKKQVQAFKKGSLLASLQKSLKSKVDQEVRAKEIIQKQKYRSGGPKKIQYFWDGDLKIQVITQELFGMYDNSLNQTDMLLGKESIIVQRMEPGDFIQFSQKSDGAQFQQIRNSQDSIDLSNLNTILSLELKLAKSEDKIQPLYEYHCPADAKHSVKPFYQRLVEETLIDDPKFSKLLRKMSNKDEIADILKFNSQEKIQTKYFCFDCNKPISEKCVFQERVLVRQPKKDVSAVKPLKPVPTRVVKEKQNVKVQEQFTEKALEEVQTALKEALEAIPELSEATKWFYDLRGIGAPSPTLQALGDMLLILLSDNREKHGQQNFKNLAASPQELVDAMMQYDKEHIDQWRIDLFLPYLSNEELTKESIMSASVSAWGIYVWTTGVVRYNIAYKKQEHLLEQKREIEEAIKVMEESDTVTQINTVINDLKKIRNFDNEVTQQVFMALSLMFGAKIDLQNFAYFLDKYSRNFDQQSITDSLLERLEPIVNSKAFQIDNMKKTSEAIAYLGCWIKNVYIYASKFNKLRDQESDLVKNWMKKNSKSQNVVYIKQELEQALNDMKRHKEATNSLDYMHVTQPLCLKSPPEDVMQVFKAILCLIGNQRKFETSEIFNIASGEVMTRMMQFDWDNIDEWRIELVEPIVKQECFTPEIIRTKQESAVGMTIWVISIYNYHKRLQDAKALEEKINALLKP